MSDLNFEHEQPAQEAEPQAEEAQPASEDPQKGEKGELGPGPHDPGTPIEPEAQEQEAAPEPTTAEQVPLGALKEERAKRQDLEFQNQQLMAQLQTPQQKEQIPDPFEEPEGYQNHIVGQVDSRVQERMERATAALQRSIVGDEEYNEKVTVFREKAMSDPVLQQAYYAADNPALFAYEEGKRISILGKMGDPEKFAEQKVQEGYAKAKAEYEAKLKELESKGALPKSLASEQSATTSTQTKDDDHTSLDSIFKT